MISHISIILRLILKSNWYNQVYFRQKHPSKQVSKASLNISNLSNGNYAVSVYKTGYKHNDVFTAYYEMGLPSQLTKTMVKQLKQVSANAPEQQVIVDVNDGVLNKELIVNENDIYFVNIEKL